MNFASFLISSNGRHVIEWYHKIWVPFNAFAFAFWRKPMNDINLVQEKLVLAFVSIYTCHNICLHGND